MNNNENNNNEKSIFFTQGNAPAAGASNPANEEIILPQNNEVNNNVNNPVPNFNNNTFDNQGSTVAPNFNNGFEADGGSAVPNFNNNPVDNSMMNQSVQNTPIESLDATNQNASVSEPVFNQNANASFAGTPQFVETPGFDNPNNIGIVPPVNNNPNSAGEKKSKLSSQKKIIFIVLIVVLLFGVGFAVYYYLSLPKTPAVTITPKDVEVPLGSDISANIEDYATIVGTPASNCVLDTSAVEPNKLGTYEFIVTCGNTSNTGQIVLADKTAPVPGLVTVTKYVNETVNASEFLGTCFDDTDCDIEFSSEDSTLTSNPEQNKKVQLVVKDSNGNEQKVEGTLNVISTGIKTYRTCTSNEQNLEDFNATMTKSYRVGFTNTISSDGSYAFGRFGTITYLYKFTDENQYEDLKQTMKKEGTVTIGNVSGPCEFNDEDKTVKIVTDLDVNQMGTEFGNNYLVSYKTLNDLFAINLKYTCYNR